LCTPATTKSGPQSPAIVGMIAGLCCRNEHSTPAPPAARSTQDSTLCFAVDRATHTSPNPLTRSPPQFRTQPATQLRAHAINQPPHAPPAPINTTVLSTHPLAALSLKNKARDTRHSTAHHLLRHFGEQPQQIHKDCTTIALHIARSLFICKRMLTHGPASTASSLCWPCH
jgi:hypothetical protein